MYNKEQFKQKVTEISEKYNISNMDEINNVLDCFEQSVMHQSRPGLGRIKAIGFNFHGGQIADFFYYVSFESDENILVPCKSTSIKRIDGGQLV